MTKKSILYFWAPQAPYWFHRRNEADKTISALTVPLLWPKLCILWPSLFISWPSLARQFYHLWECFFGGIFNVEDTLIQKELNPTIRGGAFKAFLAPFSDPNDPKKFDFSQISVTMPPILFRGLKMAYKWVSKAFLLLVGPKFGSENAFLWAF